MTARWLTALSVVLFLLVQHSDGVTTAGLRAELRTKQLLSNIRSHLAEQVEEVVQQKECDSGLILCDSTKKAKEEASPEASEEDDTPPPPKLRGSHKPVIKVNPKDVIQTMIHKVPKLHSKSDHHEPLKIKKLVKSEESDEDDDNDDDDGEDDKDESEEKKKPSKGKDVKEGKKHEKEKSDKSKKADEGKKKAPSAKKTPEADDDGADDGGIRFPAELPVFTATSTAVENELCRKHSRLYQRQLQRYKMWALMMYDATAKLPSGILQGNVNQLGDFDECLSVNAVLKDKSKSAKGSGEPPSIQGRYCLASIDIEAAADEGALKQAVKKAQAYGFIQSTAQDPGYFIPRFTTINWGVCVPSSCSHEDVEKALTEELAVYNDTAGVAFTVVVDEEACIDREDLEISYSFGTFLTVFFYLAVIAAAAYATYRDVIGARTEPPSEQEETKPEESQEKKEDNEDKKEEKAGEAEKTAEEGTEEADTPKQAGKLIRLLEAFSLKRTTEQLLSVSSDSHDEISCVHGIKAVFTAMLYVAHKVVPVALTPYHNRVAFTKVSNEAASTILRTSIIYTDSFLLVSGVLTAYNITREIQEDGKIRWFRRLVTRFIRLTPPLLAVVLWYGYISEELGSGPMWAPLVGKNAQVCRENGWSNLLYLQNMFDFQEMCAPQTHQLALDMQLSAAAPLLVFVLFKYDLIGLLILQFIYLLSAALRYITTSNNNLTLVFYHGNSVSQLYDTANFLYAQAIYRATPYVLGVTIGYYLHRHGSSIEARLQRSLAAIGWIAAACLALLSVLAPAHLADRQYEYDVQDAAQYAALSPIAWSLALGWLVVACHLGYGGRLNSLLSSWPLLVVSRISYAVYLIQFLVFNHNVAVIRTPKTFSLLDALDVTEILTTVTLACLLTLLFDMPMKQVKTVLLEALSAMSEARRASQSDGQGSAGQDQGGEPEPRDSGAGDATEDQPEGRDGAHDAVQGEEETETPELRYPPDYDEEEELAEEEEEEMNLRRSSRVRFDEAADDKNFWAADRPQEEELEDEEEEQPEDDGENFWGNEE